MPERGIGWIHRHSAIKLDHFHKRFDFDGDALPAELNVAGAAGGVADAVHATGEDNGTIFGSTGAAIGGNNTLNYARVHFRTDLLAIIEWRIKISDVSEVDAYFGFRKDADEYAFFHIDHGDIWMKSDDAGVEGPYSADSAVNAVDDTYLTLTVELLDTETAKFYINGVLKGTSTVGAVTADLMDIYKYIINTLATDVVLTTDLIDIWQKRV